jgi:hypothetical protein
VITDLDVRRRGGTILLGIAVEHAVLDVETNTALLRRCVELLESPHSGLVDCQLGHFGSFPVTLNVHHDDSVSIFVDGPDFESFRNQGAGLYLSKEEAQRALEAALSSA